MQLEKDVEVMETHYYPFGLSYEGPWLMNDAARDDAYKYNGKEWDETMGLYDYGARWYDPVLGRFTGVDPLAADFARWSAHSYSFNNPIRFIDPDGRAPDDIVIRPKRDDNTNFKGSTLIRLQSLTDDVLGYARDGKTVRILEKRSGDKTEGTGLIRDLIGSPKTVEITNDVDRVTINNKSFDLETNAYTRAVVSATASNGVGGSSTVYYSPYVEAKFVAEDGSTQRSEPETVLAHELIHADHIRTGVRVVGEKAENPDYPSNKEEEKTTIRENVIRGQMKQTLRSTGG